MESNITKINMESHHGHEPKQPTQQGGQQQQQQEQQQQFESGLGEIGEQQQNQQQEQTIPRHSQGQQQHHRQQKTQRYDELRPTKAHHHLHQHSSHVHPHQHQHQMPRQLHHVHQACLKKMQEMQHINHQIDHEKALKSKHEYTAKPGALEHKIIQILFCVVCLELPNQAIFQCKMGHIMCWPCLMHLIADARLRLEDAKCPACRIHVSLHQVARNLAVEEIASELPKTCHQCSKKIASKFMGAHLKHDCLARPSKCKYWKIGCRWNGSFISLAPHEKNCPFASKTGRDIIDNINLNSNDNQEEYNVMVNLLPLLDCQRFMLTDLKLILRLSYDGTPYFETQPFNAIDQLWIVRVRPDLTSEHPMLYQIVSLTPNVQPLSIKYLALKGPFSELNIKPVIYGHTFTNKYPASELRWLPLLYNEIVRLLTSSHGFNMRLCIFFLNVFPVR